MSLEYILIFFTLFTLVGYKYGYACGRQAALHHLIKELVDRKIVKIDTSVTPYRLIKA